MPNRDLIDLLDELHGVRLQCSDQVELGCSTAEAAGPVEDRDRSWADHDGAPEFRSLNGEH